ncbi:MAG: hypothetical protein ISR77_33460 [Pirellulaceae bacterium]|nr:hypothetical protein [Pirellulaceae bacterium]
MIPSELLGVQLPGNCVNFDAKEHSVEVFSTPDALMAWNGAKVKAVAMFHVTY